MLLTGLGKAMPDMQTLEIRLPPCAGGDWEYLDLGGGPPRWHCIPDAYWAKPNGEPRTPATTGRQETCFNPLRFPFVGVRHKPGPVMPEGGGQMWPCEVAGTGDLIVDHVLGIGLWALVLSSLFRRQ